MEALMGLQDDINNIYKLDAASIEIAYSGTKAESDLNLQIQKSWPLAVSVIRRLEQQIKDNDYMHEASEAWGKEDYQKLEAVIENIARENVRALRPDDSPAFEHCVKEEIKQLMEGK